MSVKTDELDELRAENKRLMRIISALMYGYTSICEADFRTGQVTFLRHDSAAFARLGLSTAAISSWDDMAALYVESGVHPEDRLKIRHVLGKAYLQENLRYGGGIKREYRNEIGVYGELRIIRISEDAALIGFSEKDAEITSRIGRVYTDSLTQVKNRKYYDEQLAAKICQALVMADLDSFKEVNDVFGHPCGDAALAAVAAALRASVRDEDDVVRYGGDEFLIAFRHIASETLSARVEAMRRAVENIRLASCPQVRLTMSFGVTFGLGQAKTMLTAADVLLYEAKKTKNTFVIREFTPELHVSEPPPVPCPAAGGGQQAVDEARG